jgi:hypothetical protein
MPNLLLMRGAFVIRLRQETNPAEGHFEGSIEEVDSGKQLNFQSSTELLRFLGERFQAAFKDTARERQAVPPETEKQSARADRSASTAGDEQVSEDGRVGTETS